MPSYTLHVHTQRSNDREAAYYGRIRMKCGLFNDPFDYYGHIGSGNGNRLHKLLGNGRGGWVGSETMKDDTFLRSARNP